MVQIYKTPFAAQGDKDAIPVPVQGDGVVSVTQGFGYDYEREYEDPAAKDIRREIMNGILHDLSEAIGEIQQFGFAAWQPVDGGWPVGANVNHGGGVWQSLANANTEEPGAGALWKELLFGNLVPASEAVRGVIQLATVAQARALTDDTRALTPKKLGDAMDTHVLGMGQTRQNVLASRAANTTYTNSTGRVIEVTISVVSVVNGVTSASYVIDGTTIGSSSITEAVGGAVGAAIFSFMVLPGETYRVNTYSSTTISHWREVR